MFNGLVKEITLNIKSRDQLSEIDKFFKEKGETLVHINFLSDTETLCFNLKNLRNIDRKAINILRNKEISLNIH